MKKSSLLAASVFIGLLPSFGVLAEEQEKTWVDEQHQEIRATLRRWAHTMDKWMGSLIPISRQVPVCVSCWIANGIIMITFL